LKLAEVANEIRSLHTTENATIHVPVREIILLSSSENGNPVRMASLLFRNMSGFLPERLREETDINRSAQKHYSVFAWIITFCIHAPR
jgi:hypothetical protein